MDRHRDFRHRGGKFCSYPKKKLPCELKCGEFLYHEDMAQHLYVCCVTEMMCTLGCGIMLTRKELSAHLRDKCELRMLTCEHCKEEFKSRYLCAHGEKCPKMNVKCELKCGETIRREDITLHQNNECGMVEDTCKLDCGLKMRRNELRIHSCINRKATKVEIHEQRDMCRVKRTNGKYGGYKKDILTEVKERDNALLICGVCEGIMREACFDTSSGEQFCSCCEVQDSSSSTTQPYSPFPTYSSNRTYFTPKPKRTPPKQTPTPNVPVRNTINLLKCSCPLSERGCTWIGILKECENHLGTCGYVGDECKLGCGEVLHRNQLNVHKDSCPCREVKCEHCSRKFKFRDMPKHLRECPKMEVSCELNCGMVMLREDLTQHLKQDCGMMVETCTLGCRMRMTRDELKIHVINTCVQRKVPCEHCKEDFKFCDIPNHLKKCPKMEVSCDLKCGIVMCREDMAQHVEQNCVEKEVECPFVKYKCEVTSIKRKHLGQHLEEKETKHLGLKLSEFENIVTEQSIEIKQMVLEKHLENKRSEYVNSKFNELEDRLSQISTQNRQKEETHMTTINRLSEQINTLYSVNSTAKLEWNICNITHFVQILNLQPEQRQVGEFTLNIYFERNSIRVSFNNKHKSYRTVNARFVISLYSNTKMRVIKQYKHGISKFPTGGVKQEISCISNSDVEEFSRIGATNDITLEMYVTVL